MKSKKGKIIFGVSSLFIAAILQAVFLYYLQYDWIVLAFTCIYAFLFLKCLKDASVVNWLISRWSKKTLKVTGIIVLAIGVAFMPQVSGLHLGVAECACNMISFICWMIGLLLMDVAKEQASCGGISYE